jgi:ankyrin repeat protein
MTDRDRRTPLSWAAENGRDEVVSLLLNVSQSVATTKDEYDQTPMSWAANNGHDTTITLLACYGLT